MKMSRQIICSTYAGVNPGEVANHQRRIEEEKHHEDVEANYMFNLC